MSWYRYESERVILRLYVQPGARKNEVVGLMEDELKIKLAAPPIEGRANVELLKYLSGLFRVPKSHVLLKSGEKSRHKTVEIRGCLVLPECVLILT